MQPHLVWRALPWAYSLPPVNGQHGQEGWPCRCNAPILQELFNLSSLKHTNTFLHPPDLHGYKLTEDKQNRYHLVVHLLHTSIQNVSLPCPCMAHPPSMVVQVTTFWDGILLNTLQASSILPHFAYMSTKLLPTCHFERSANEHTCPIQERPHWHMHLAPPQKWQSSAAHLPVAFVGRIPVPSALA